MKITKPSATNFFILKYKIRIVKLELFPSKYYNDTFVGEKGQEIWYYYPPVAVNSVPDYNGVPTRINPDTGTTF